jgi:glycosyltransferase involved in cell wall biosynthesis
VGGTPEEFPEGAGGILVPCRDPERLASALASLALDQQQRVAMAAAGRRRLESSFTIDRMVDDYARLYRGLVNR